MKLTKRTVDSLTPQAKDYFVWDDELKGFGIRVLPKGRKTYLVQYRADGRQRRAKVGVHGTLTPDEARHLARRLLGSVSGGANPAEKLRIERRAPTVNGLCDRFLAEHVEVRLKPSTQREYRRCCEIFIKPRIGSFRINDVKRADIAQLHHDLRDRPYQANRVREVLSKMFNLADLWGLREEGTNPVRLVPKYPERKRERYLKPEELRRLVQVLEHSQKDGSESVYVIAAFKLLILTGCRLSEIQTLKWDYAQDGYLNLPDSKTGPRRVPLSPEAQQVLGAIPRIDGNPYVVVGKEEGAYVTDMQKPWRRIRIRADLPHVRIHDLRHTFASVAISNGLSLPLVAKLLGHTQMQTTQRYAHLMDAPVRDAAHTVGAALGGAFTLAQGGPALRVIPGGDNSV